VDSDRSQQYARTTIEHMFERRIIASSLLRTGGDEESSAQAVPGAAARVESRAWSETDAGRMSKCETPRILVSDGSGRMSKNETPRISDSDASHSMAPETPRISVSNGSDSMRFDGARMSRSAVALHDQRKLVRAAELPPGPAAIRILDDIDPNLLSPEHRVDLLRTWEAQESWLAVRRAVAVCAVAGTEPADNPCDATGGADRFSYQDVSELSVEAEVAGALRVSTVTAGRRIASARLLLGKLRSAIPALERGDWSVGHLRACEDELITASGEASQAVLSAVMCHATTDTPGRLRRRLRKELAAVDAAAVVARIVERSSERSAMFVPEPDLRATVVISGPWDSVAWSFRQLDEWARRERDLRSGSIATRDDRPERDTLAELRADAFVQAAKLLAVELAQHDSGAPQDPELVIAIEAALRERGVPVVGATDGPRRGRTWSTAVVMVTEATAFGLADDPGFVPGYGFVPARVGRELLASAETWRRFLIDDESGRLLDAGRTRYRPSAHLRELVTARDQTCSFDACERPSTVADLDHVENFDGTNTTPDNLRPPCRSHHRLKTHGQWRVEVLPDGYTQWTSPTGHRYREHPDPLWQRLPRRRAPDSAGPPRSAGVPGSGGEPG
jgi:hypothetical protein